MARIENRWDTPRRTKNGKGKTMLLGMGVLPSRGDLMMYLPTAKGRMRLTEKQHPALYKELVGALKSVGIKV